MRQHSVFLVLFARICVAIHSATVSKHSLSFSFFIPVSVSECDCVVCALRVDSS